MTDSTHAKLPQHLRRYMVDQNYARYTPEDQAVWRYIMRQLKNFLSVHAHPSYLNGLVETGISTERIPSIAEVDEHLEKFGWGAVPVSGFIPPAAFMEFQSLGILPIASDMRTLAHLQYTPAPDIVHEAAGHAPFLADREYADYLRMYGEVARNAIISKEDLDQYEAIRILSDIKEDPRSTPAEIEKAEKRLAEVTAAIREISEAALLSRMNWWTAEYGLVGDVKTPKIFGAGLLSSVGESRSCLQDKVKKIPLSVDCVEFSYDITEPQPQLFVTPNFAKLGEVLESLATRLSYRLGGEPGLKAAIHARTVNSVQWSSGLQAAGVVEEYMADEFGKIAYVRLSGPCQLAHDHHELPNQGVQRHAHGFSSPVGLLAGETRDLATFTEADLARIGAQAGQNLQLKFASGVQVSGTVKSTTVKGGRLLLITWSNCKVEWRGKLLFDPAWGEYDMAVGQTITSVFAGPADRSRFGSQTDFVNSRVPARALTPEERRRHNFLQSVRQFRESERNRSAEDFRKLEQNFFANHPNEWLPGLELLEIAHLMGLSADVKEPLLKHLDPARFESPIVKECLRDGLNLATKAV